MIGGAEGTGYQQPLIKQSSLFVVDKSPRRSRVERASSLNSTIKSNNNSQSQATIDFTHNFPGDRNFLESTAKFYVSNTPLKKVDSYPEE